MKLFLNDRLLDAARIYTSLTFKITDMLNN